MRARVGFVLFIVVFLVMAIIVPLFERTFGLFAKSAEALRLAAEQSVRWSRFVTRKVTAFEWKHFMQKA